MTAVLAFIVQAAFFLWLFRRLTSPDSKLSAQVRVAVAIVLVVGVALLGLWFDCSSWSVLASAAAIAVGSTAMHGTGLARFTDALGRLRFPLYTLAVATIAALVYLFVPITTYLTSPGELSIHLGHLATVNARDAMIVVYVAAALYAFAISSRMRTALTLLAVGTMVATISYTYLLPFGYPIMSGLTFEQIPISGQAVALRSAADLVVLVIVAVATCAALLRFGPRPMIIGILLVNTSLAGASAVSVLRARASDATNELAAANPAERPLRFSPNHPNVLIVFLDRFMGSYIESILQSDPGLADRLSGFTWFPRSVSAGENSVAGMQGMLGGYDYLPVEINARGKPLREQSVEAFSILPYNFSKHHYHVNVVGPRGMGFTMAGDCRALQMANVTCTHVSLEVARRKAREVGFSMEDLSKANYADLLVLLASMRVVPYAAKEVLYEQGPWQPFLNHTAGNTFREWAELDALHALTDAVAKESNFNFISNILPHEPYYMGENCKPQREQFVVSDEEVARRGHMSLFSLQHAIAARCALLAVADYLDFLKKSGVYDNTKIVIVSDHGIVGPVQDTSTRARAGGTQSDIYVRTRSLLLVKDRDATGPLRVSETFMPNAEVPRIVCEEIGGCVNPYLRNKVIEAHGRDDPFYVSLVPWQFNLQNPTSFVINQQLVLKGKDPYNAQGWVIP
jgi:hypothetical protein